MMSSSKLMGLCLRPEEGGRLDRRSVVQILEKAPAVLFRFKVAVPVKDKARPAPRPSVHRHQQGQTIQTPFKHARIPGKFQSALFKAPKTRHFWPISGGITGPGF